MMYFEVVKNVNGGISMNFKLKKWKMPVLFSALSLALLGSLTYAGIPGHPQITADQKSKVKGRSYPAMEIW